jgi:hypothetical protein
VIRFMCWCPDRGEVSCDATKVLASDHEEAAERFAEECFNSGDPFHDIDVAVLGPDGSFRHFHVEVEAVPEFHAGRLLRTGHWSGEWRDAWRQIGREHYYTHEPEAALAASREEG